MQANFKCICLELHLVVSDELGVYLNPFVTRNLMTWSAVSADVWQQQQPPRSVSPTPMADSEPQLITVALPHGQPLTFLKFRDSNGSISLCTSYNHMYTQQLHATSRYISLRGTVSKLKSKATQPTLTLAHVRILHPSAPAAMVEVSVDNMHTCMHTAHCTPRQHTVHTCLQAGLVTTTQASQGTLHLL